jgi:hypothetical protein
MAKVKFDLGSIVKNVHNAIDPESALPPDQEKNPLGYRAARLAELIKGIKEKQELIADEYAKMETNLAEVVADLNKMAKETAVEDDKKEDGGDKKEDDKKDDGDDKKEDDKKDDGDDKKE